MSRAVDVAYRSIKEGILTGELRSGESLPEKELAEQIGVSRTPIREALSRLSNEGLVVVERYHRNYVAHFTEEDINEILELRAILEGYVAGRAAIHIETKELDRLQKVQDEIDSIIEERGADAQKSFIPLNNEFHDIIRRAAKSPRTDLLLVSSLDIPFNALSRFEEHMGENLSRACLYHREIISALKAHHTERATAQMRAHILSLMTMTQSP